MADSKKRRSSDEETAADLQGTKKVRVDNTILTDDPSLKASKAPEKNPENGSAPLAAVGTPKSNSSSDPPPTPTSKVPPSTPTPVSVSVSGSSKDPDPTPFDQKAWMNFPTEEMKLLEKKLYTLENRFSDRTPVSGAEMKLFQIYQARSTFGEILPAGVTQLLDSHHLDAANGVRLVDLGCGRGKAALQAFLQFPNLQEVVAVELSQTRFQVAAQAYTKFAALYPRDFVVQNDTAWNDQQKSVTYSLTHDTFSKETDGKGAQESEKNSTQTVSWKPSRLKLVHIGTGRELWLQNDEILQPNCDRYWAEFDIVICEICTGDLRSQIAKKLDAVRPGTKVLLFDECVIDYLSSSGWKTLSPGGVYPTSWNPSTYFYLRARL